MIKLTKGRIFPADDRAGTFTEGARTYSNFGLHESFGSLNVFNEETIAEGHSIAIRMQHDCQWLVVPVVGTVVYKEENGTHVYRAGVFVFVIEGVFEVQGRLLQSRDGLSLWNSGSPTDMEALSAGAIILLVEARL